MADTIDDVIAALSARGNVTQVQWADRQTGWDEGAIIVRRDGDGVVLTRLGRVEAEDRIERYESEAAAAAFLRRRLLDPPVRTRSPEERAASVERMQRRASEIKAELASRPSGEEVSRGVIAYLGKGISAHPRADVAACAAVATRPDPEAMVDAVLRIVDASLATEVDWGTTDLAGAGRLVVERMRGLHLGLTEEALDALAWNATYAWR